jgi:hypothetical protein
MNLSTFRIQPMEINYKKNQNATVTLIVEGEGDSLWGRVHHDDNRIVDDASSIEQLKLNMQRLLFDFHNLSPESYEFQIEYDLKVNQRPDLSRNA